MDYRLREIEESDLEKIQKIEEDSFLFPFSRWQFWYYCHHYKDMFLVVERKGEILGYIIGTKGFKKINIASIAVKKKYRRRGIATELIKHFIKKVKGRTKVIHLQVRVSNKEAIALYEKMGFNYKKLLRHYYQDGEDALLYCENLQ